jgi:hypothetical protein
MFCSRIYLWPSLLKVLEVLIHPPLRRHLFLSGMSGTNNDLNVLQRSPIFDPLHNETMPPVEYNVNDHEYHIGYYLSGGIYLD